MKRSEVPVNLTWDLSLIYKSPEEGWKAADELLALGFGDAASGGAASAEESQSRQGSDPYCTYYFFHRLVVITAQNYKKNPKVINKIINIDR